MTANNLEEMVEVEELFDLSSCPEDYGKKDTRDFLRDAINQAYIDAKTELAAQELPAGLDLDFILYKRATALARSRLQEYIDIYKTNGDTFSLQKAKNFARSVHLQIKQKIKKDSSLKAIQQIDDSTLRDICNRPILGYLPKPRSGDVVETRDNGQQLPVSLDIEVTADQNAYNDPNSVYVSSSSDLNTTVIPSPLSMPSSPISSPSSTSAASYNSQLSSAPAVPPSLSRYKRLVAGAAVALTVGVVGLAVNSGSTYSGLESTTQQQYERECREDIEISVVDSSVSYVECQQSPVYIPAPQCVGSVCYSNSRILMDINGDPENVVSTWDKIKRVDYSSETLSLVVGEELLGTNLRVSFDTNNNGIPDTTHYYDVTQPRLVISLPEQPLQLGFGERENGRFIYYASHAFEAQPLALR